MNQLTSGPNPTPDFGYDFDYAVWTAGTRIDLVNVPFNNDYRDVVKFSSKNALKQYIDSLVSSGITIEQMTYVRPNNPIRVNIPFNRAVRYNYLRASNPRQPIDGNDIQKDFYYFILDAKYVAPNTTELLIQLDVWQTFVYDLTFGNSYVDRGHVGIANENQFNHYGRDYLTVPEGLDIGSDYRTVSKSTVEVMGMGSNLSINTNILVVSTVDLEADPGTADNPKLVTASGSFIGTIVSGAALYVFESPEDFSGYMASISETPWVSQGIVNISVIPKITRYIPDFEYNASFTPTKLDGAFLWPKKHYMKSNWRQAIIDALPARYRSLKKFLTSPYSGIELTTWSATPVHLKPELWNRDDAFVMERVNIMPPNQRVQFYPRGYNTYRSAEDGYNYFGDLNPDYIAPQYKKLLEDTGDDWGDYLDTFTQINDLPTVPVVNNMAISYLASNKNSIAAQRSIAQTSKNVALMGMNTAYAQAQGGIAQTQALTNIGINAATQAVGINNAAAMTQSVVGALSGVAGGAVIGAPFPGGAVLGAAAGAINGAGNIINTAVQNDANNQNLAVSNRAARQSTAANIGQQSLVADTNADYAKYAAVGNYQNAIAGINGTVQDAAMIQPTMSGQYGGDSANIMNLTAEVSLRIKLIDLNAIAVVGEYWLRYGYAVRRFMTIPQSLMVMTKFTYWKLLETYITSSNVPESFKQVIRGILENGVTVWKNPSDIGMIDIADNEPLEGIRY